MWNVVPSKKFIKALDDINPKDKTKIFSFLEELEKWPILKSIWDIKKLQGFLNRYRLRVGVYRVLFVVHKQEVIIDVVSVDHRKDAYKK